MKTISGLKKLRKTAGLTLQTMSDQTGIPVSTLGAYEKGTRNIPDDVREKLAEFFHVEGCRIYSDEQPMQVNEESVPYQAGSTSWNSLSTEQLETLIKECLKDADWSSVEKVAAELSNRKLREKLR